MLRRTIVVMCAVAALLASAVPPVNAGLYSGTCVLKVTFNFNSPVKTLNTAPGYSVSVSPAADVDPTWSGQQPCAVSLDPLSPARETSVSASGSSSIWACGGVLASGSWDQQWTDESGSASPSAVFGSHTITGTWGAWTLEVRNSSLSFVGVAELTVDPSDATKASRCPSGFSSLTMTGVMAFQDP